jgi:hypothetical protein
MSGQLRAPAALLPHPLNSMLGGPQGRSGWFGDEKDQMPLPQFEPQTALPQLVVIR